MLQEFLQFLEREQLLDADSRVLLAISGGLDSVTMGHLFREADIDFGVAHCNFQLRGQASEEDEQFVLALAKKWEAPFFSRRFDTEGFAREAGQPIQVAARELRYAWLEEVRRENEFTHIATAHHLNDSIETLLYNLTKGCGIRGLHGIPLKNGHIIRPLLFASRSRLEEYVSRKGIRHREDATNQEVKYHRNKIRHNVIPGLREINPAFEQTMAENIARFRQAEQLLAWAMRHIAQDVILSYGEPFRLSIKELESFGSVLPTVLFELLYPYGFNTSQVNQLAQSLNSTGAIFHAPGYRLLVEREELVVEKATESGNTGPQEYQISTETNELEVPEGRFSLSRQPGQPADFSSSTWNACLDAEHLKFPLKLRRWQAGDVFQPLGMGGRHQKLQDLFSNQKASRFEKERAWVLEDTAGRICWVVGYRIDERFKITSATQGYWALKFAKM